MKQTTRVLGALVTLVAGAALGVASPATAITATPTTTTLVSSANPSTVGQAVTLTATVTGDAPTGTVTFGEPGLTLGTVTVTAGATSSVASLVVSSWTAGVHTVTATYSGDDAGNESSGTSLTQTVVAPAPPPVVPAPHVAKPKIKLHVSTDAASVGDKVRLKWRSKHADLVTASGDWGGAQPAKGSKAIRLSERGKHVFKLTVQNASGAKTAKVVVMASRKAKELELVVTEDLVLVGEDVEVAADGLAKGETYTVRLDGKPVLTGKADKHGDVARTFALAKTTKEGPLALTITGSNPGRVGEAVLNVIRPKTLDVEVADEKLTKNQQQTVTVTGLAAGEQVTVMYAAKKLTVGKADENGEFSYEFSVGKEKGERTVKVFGAVPTRVGEATFTITSTNGGTGDGGNGGGEDTQL